MFNFNALVSRIKYIPRWSLMRQSRQEYLAEHTTEVMQIAHTLAAVAKEKFGAEVDEKNIVLCGLYHDISEILTGDMPTPVKYNDDVLKKAYKDMEAKATGKMIDTIDPAVKSHIAPFVKADMLSDREQKILKAADKLSALIKCMEELGSGNSEFKLAYESTKHSLEKMELPEIDYFMANMLPSYNLCLDELAKI
ncbi:MAG: 5'-deoxynucleotidase [Oscillospiraceae bacterium]|nr:5'-deoxynucleotidase [Oscillospiraceae bacterium]MBP1570274.1 5'-deoxynucleotidase [Oscillospiraceae bacterium]MBQ5313494.1 5'-deoxynucleotidase [Oscillospiraceae bacterium]MBQ5325395.1 5'-deoxynucleotidase [Oscillospiraceae bacterium]